MPSIDSLKASDGSENAAVATVQSVRAPAATTIVVDTVTGINTNFHATMGTPHTFVDPVTSETITVISEATAVDFKGHVDGANLEIDTIAPGYTDAGSAVNDIVIIKPTTQWADEVATVLEVAHNDDGTLKNNAVTTDVVADSAVTSEKLSSTVAFRGTTTQTIGTGSMTDVTTYTEDFDLGSDFDHTTGLFTAPYDGIYNVSANLEFTDCNARVIIEIEVNATTVVARGYSNGDAAQHDPSGTPSVTIQLTAGDTVQVNAFQEAGVSKSLVSWSSFSGFLVGRT